MKNSLQSNKSILPTSFTEMLGFCENLSNSELVPTYFRGKPYDLMLAFDTAKRFDLPIIGALHQIYPIMGRVCLGADLLLSIAARHPDFDYHEIELTDKYCTCTIKRKNCKNSFIYRFGIEDAQNIMVYEKGKMIPMSDKPNWKNNPKRMLRARAIAYCAKDAFPEYLAGIYEKTDMQDHGDTYNSMPKEITIKENETSSSALLSKIKENDAKDLSVEEDIIEIDGIEIDGEEFIYADNECKESEPIIKSSVMNLIRLKKEGKVPKYLEDKWCEKAKIKYLNQIREEDAKKCIEYLNKNTEESV